jgi:hypothetical protein
VSAYLSRADPRQSILISDSACDQSLITRDWMVLKWTSHHVLMTGAFAGQNISENSQLLSVQPHFEMKMEMSMLQLQMKHYMMITEHKLNPFCPFIKI